MKNTLGLDDDLDDVELIRDLERAFDVEMLQADASRLLKVGDIYDWLLRKIPQNETQRKCASAMAFYRLRRVFRDLRNCEVLTPSSDLDGFKTVYTKSFVKEIAEATGLNLPRPSYSRLGAIGGYTALFPFVYLLLCAILFGVGFSVPVNPGFVFVIALPLAMILVEIDPGCLPKNCQTFADLAKQTAKFSYGHLIKLGADLHEDKIWQAMIEVLLDHTALPKDEITRETFILQKMFKKAA